MDSEERVSITADGLRLEGRLAVPRAVPLAVSQAAQRAVVLCHPHPQYGGTMDNPVVRAAAGRLQSAGVATLRFNFRGVGGSEGSHANGVGECIDARAAVDFLAERSAVRRVTLGGYSFGAMIALRVGHQHPGVDRLAAIAPPLSMFDLDFIGGCDKPKLFLVGDRDQFCPYEVFRHAIDALPPPKTTECLAGADHFLIGFEEQIGAHVVHFVS